MTMNYKAVMQTLMVVKRRQRKLEFGTLTEGLHPRKKEDSKDSHLRSDAGAMPFHDLNLELVTINTIRQTL